MLHISTIPNLRFLRAHQLDIKESMKPVRVVIAEEMGYIAVFFESNNSTLIHNYTINARFIREITFPFIAADAIAYVNPS